METVNEVKLFQLRIRASAMTGPDEGPSRRQFLGAFGAGLGVTASGTQPPFHRLATDEPATSSPAPRFSLSYPPDVVDSFLNVSAATPYLMGRSGWDDVPIDEKIHTLRRFHAEKLDLHTNFGGSGTSPTAVAGGPATVEGHFAEDIALPAAGQHRLEVQVDEFDFWYDKLPPSKRWTAPDESVIESAEEFVVRNFDGEPRIDDRYHSGPPTLFFDRYRDHMAEAAVTFLSHGYTEVYLDNATSPTFRGVDFSKWARRAFQSYLQTLSNERLDDLGIKDPASFDIRAYLQDQGLAPSDVSTPFGDPVAREFKRFQFSAHRDYLAAYRQQIHDAFPKRSENNGIAVVGNLGMDQPRPSAIVLGDTVDIITGESEQTVPPEKILDWKYKLQRAAGRFERQVVSVGSILANRTVSTAEGLDPSREYPTLLNLEVAEGFANGGMRSISLAGWGMTDDRAIDNWIRTDGSVNETLQEFLDFAWANKPFLQESVPRHDVVVVYSLPSVMWQRAPGWGRRHSSHRKAFQGAATLLRKYQLPYDVLVFGLPGVWDDADQLDRLTEYRTVLLPDIAAASDAQVSAIRSALDAGVHVVATGGAPDRDADWQSRDDLASLLNDHDNASVVDESPGLSVYDTGDTEVDLRPLLVENGEQLRIDASGVGVTVRRQVEADRTIVHFVNYAYDPDADAVPTHRNVDVSLALPEAEPGSGRWVTPAGTTDVAIGQSDGRVTVTLPKLDVYGILILGPDSSALSEGDRTAAEDAVARAEDAIATARDGGRTHLGLTRAKAELENARVALDRESYAVAETAANRAREEASSAIEPPVIGYDTGHGQPVGDEDWASYEKLRRRFDRYTYREVATWSAETLSELDLLLIPPTEQGSYEFSTTERDRLHAYLEAGGRVVVLGRPGMAEDISTLTDRYGFGFDGDPIVQLDPVFTKAAGEDVVPRQFDARTVPSTLTQYAISFRTINATPVTIADDAVEELGFVHEQSSAYVNRSGPEDERSDDDVSAEGRPLIAARAIGDGYIAAVGTTDHFAAPTQGEDGGRGGPQDDPLVTAILRTATTGAAGFRVDSTATETGVDETESGTPTTTVSTPGFGIAHALGGVAGLAVLCKWLFEDAS